MFVIVVDEVGPLLDGGEVTLRSGEHARTIWGAERPKAGWGETWTVAGLATRGKVKGPGTKALGCWTVPGLRATTPAPTPGMKLVDWPAAKNTKYS